MDLPELLAPAGSAESVAAAVENGCDAVYAGAGLWNARLGAKNLTLPELEKAVDYCHLRGVKLYVAANTLIKNNEINRFMEFMESIYSIGADGAILQDIGCAALVNSRFPDFYLLASTQISAANAESVNFLYNNGFKRIILPRELSITEISYICDNTKAEIECFIHGALCVCYSGQCLMSSFNGGRSGNRGLCAQPCRLDYGLYSENGRIAEGNLLSPKDMLGLYDLPKLIKCGVKSLKIEGRMKSPEYVAAVTAVYRRHIDRYFENPSEYTVDEGDVRRLAAVFNRGGFTRGYFSTYADMEMLTKGKPGNMGVVIGKIGNVRNGEAEFNTLADISPGDGVEIGGRGIGAYITETYSKGQKARIKLSVKGNVLKDDLVYRTYDKVLMDRLKATYAKTNRRLSIDGVFTAKRGEQMKLCIRSGNTVVTSFAGVPDEAQKAPVTIEGVKKQLLKTGGTPFVFSSIEIELEAGLFINNRELNELRRKALTELEAEIIEGYKRKAGESRKRNVINEKRENSFMGGISVLVRNAEQLSAVRGFEFSRLYVDFNAEKQQIEHFKKKGISVYKCLSRVGRERATRNVCESLYDGYLVRALGQLKWVAENGYNAAADYTLNVLNTKTASFLKEKGVSSVCVSPELTLTEIDRFDGTPVELVVYGKITLMTTVQCPIGSFTGKRHKEEKHCTYANTKRRFEMRSKDRGVYSLLTDCENCQCFVLDKKPVNLLEKPEGLTEISSCLQRIEFTTESEIDVKNIMSIFLDASAETPPMEAYFGRYDGGVK